MTTRPSILDSLNDLWWARVPVTAMRVARSLPQVLTDGFYLTAWRPVGAAALPLSFLLGLFLGWQQMTPGDTFTFSIPLMAVLVAVSSLGAGPGAWHWLGYVMADLFLARHDNATYLYGVTLAERVTRVLVQVAEPYLLLALLLITTPFFVSRLRQVTVMQTLSRLNLPPAGRFIVDLVLQVGLTAALVYVWTLAVPTLIRPVYTMVKDNPPIEAIQPLQQEGLTLVLVAAGVAALRMVLEYLAVRKPGSLRRVAQQRSVLLAEAPQTGEPLPAWVTLPVQAGLVTLLLAGLFETWSDVAQFWFVLLVIMGVRKLLAGPLKWWAHLVGRIPLVLRLIAGFVASYFIAQAIVGGMWDDTSTFRPIVLSTLASLLVFAVLVPDAAGRGERPAARAQVQPYAKGGEA